jgi:subtilisin family serine protease
MQILQHVILRAKAEGSLQRWFARRESGESFTPLRSIQDDMLRKATVDKSPRSLTYDDYREGVPLPVEKIPRLRVFRRLAWVMFLLILLFSSLVWIAWAQKPEGAQSSPPEPAIDPALRYKIEPALFKQLSEDGSRSLPIMVEMEASANLGAALAEPDPTRRRQAVVASLQATAQRSQAGVLALLSQREASGTAARIRPLWIVNAVAADANLDTVAALVAQPEVRLIRQDREYHITERPEARPGALPDQQTVQWNIAQVRADVARNALNLDGSGVVVANIDTGVDFLHPALMTRYRGYDPHGLHMHTCNWFDATGAGATYPLDGYGHGTHTMGTMVGGEGIGMAPGATWIAVRAFDNQGTALESWLHAAMQWIIDPGPGCTPADVVNSSWSSTSGGNSSFRDDVQALRAAGIFAPFAAGNDGPDSASIDAPASYPEAFAVGAVSSQDTIASFSSRGPSTWYGANLIKPEVSAPGINVLSSLPGGTYGESSGTSMATPHVAGLAALMLEADPALTVEQIETIIKATARPLGEVVPNNAYGWGRIDAYAAVAAAAQAGVVQGVVSRANDGVPIAGALLTADPSVLDTPVTSSSESDGSYRIALAADRYTLTASAFGYQPASRLVEVTMGVTVTENFSLSALPTGTLRGRVTSGGQSIAPPATVAINDTSVAVTTDASGVYSVHLPGGSYSMTVTSRGHRIAVDSSVPIVAGQVTTRDFDLDTAPAILLVDSGAWYYNSEIDYYQQALDELHYMYDVRPVTDAVDDVPSVDELLPYDVLFWSSPQDSPGYINASDVLTSYLKSGGSLFLSGQDVAYYDDHFPFISAPYFRHYLKARFVSDSAASTTLTGVPGSLLDGLSFSIAGAGGADNQISPDVIGVADADFAASVVKYTGDDSGGQQVGHCLPYRALYLAYGFEAITDSNVRTEVISRALAWFDGPPASSGVELKADSDALVGNFGESVKHTLRVRNLAETGPPLSVSIAADGYQWPTSVITEHVTLLPCHSRLVDVAVQVPLTAQWAASDSMTVAAQSASSTATATLETRSPAPVLLVDDDRWYDVEDHYRNALSANGIPYDEWQVPWNFSGAQPPSPPLESLEMYPIVLWFSAYDWHQTLTPLEEERLGAYLDGGGRLYYNGQDYLYETEGPDEFARTYLGVADYTEDFSSTLVSGVRDNPVGSLLGPYDLAYPYPNYSDALTPTASARVAFVGQEQQPNALTTMGSRPGMEELPWRTTFFAFDPDGLSDAANVDLMRRVVGWLSWLGDSTLETDKSTALDTDRLNYTLVLHNDGWQDIPSAYFTATFASDLNPIPDSISGGASWDPARRALVWSGPLAQGQRLAFSYRADIAGPLPAGHVISHTVWMGYDKHFIQFDRVAATAVNVPVLSQSAFSVTPGVVDHKDTQLAYVLHVVNTGVADGLVRATNPLPGALALVTGSLQADSGTFDVNDRVITWDVPVAVGETTTLTYTAIITEMPPGSGLRNRVWLDDGLGNTLPVDALLSLHRTLFLPLILK